MHRLKSISIYNFRSCAEMKDVPLSDFTPLVGYNNAGKSNVLAAIGWLLKKETLQASDFYFAHMPVIVEATVEGITDEVMNGLDPVHMKKIILFVRDGMLRVRREQPTPGCKASEIKLKFRDQTKPEDDKSAWEGNPTGIDQAVSALFPEPIVINAMEDAGKDVAKVDSGSTIGRLIAKLMTTVTEQNGDEIAERLLSLQRILGADGGDRAKELVAFDRRSNEIVSEFFPGVMVRVHIPAPELSAIFKNGTLKVFERHRNGTTDVQGKDVSTYGHGTQRAIQMALVKQLADADKGKAAARTLLLIDEPELYMHPQAVSKVRSALRKLSGGAYQVVFTTHSPLMIGRDELGSTLVLYKDSIQTTKSRPRLADALGEFEEGSKHQLGLLFDLAGASQVFFTDRVVLAEGRTENALIPDLFAAHHGAPLADHRLGFIPMHGVENVAKCLRILAAMEMPARAIVDLDYAFRGAVKAGLVPKKDPDYLACKERCAAAKAATGCDLGSDGFPEGSLKRSGFESLAKDPVAATHIDSLHKLLKSKGIWLWKGGAIEAHLGLDSKDEDAWLEFSKRLESTGLDAVADKDSVRDCMTWLLSV